ncbi:MAG: winged helix-turn-helix domain-containing protein, partial [Clostridia bacterium]|nr:winged helix-turn-helix domain-containing protein [Clostridia bacterium]
LEVKKQGGRTITLPFSASALADYICADRSAMMREMAAMKRDGLIDYERRRVTVL